MYQTRILSISGAVVQCLSITQGCEFKSFKCHNKNNFGEEDNGIAELTVDLWLVVVNTGFGPTNARVDTTGFETLRHSH